MKYHSAKRRRHARRHVDALIRSHTRSEPSRKTADSFEQLVKTVRSNSDLLKPFCGCRHSDESYAGTVIQGLKNLAVFHKVWTKSCTGWIPKGDTPRAVFASLVRDLIDIHPVPKFMISCWLMEPEADVRTWQRWYVHFSRAGTIRGTSIPYLFDREQAGCFASAPDHLSIDEALRWGYFRRTAASERKTKPRLMTRRRWKAAQAERQQWRRGEWKALGIPNFQVDDTRLSLYGSRSWTIREILSQDELTREGNALNHCVGSYAWRCMSGVSSIWSLKVHGRSSSSRLITIEVDPRKQQIVTALGFRNSAPSRDARRVMETWARVNNLQIASRV